MYKKVKDSFEPDQFDHVVGVFASGLLPMMVASDFLEGEEVVLRYSNFSRGDDEVKVTESMEKRAEIGGTRSLIVDDTIQTRETIAVVSDFLFERGASKVYALPLKSESNNDDIEDMTLLEVGSRDDGDEIS